MLDRMSLQAKLAVGFGTLLVVLLAIGGVGYYAVGEMAKISADVQQNLISQDVTSDLVGASEKQTVGVRGFLLKGSEDLLNYDEEGKAEFQESLSRLEKTGVSEQGKKLLEEVRTQAQQFRKYCDREIQLRRAGKTKEAVDLAFSPEVSQARTVLRKSIADLEESQKTINSETLQREKQTQSRTRALLLLLVAIAVVVGLLVASVTARSITRAISRMAAVLHEIAGNNLSVEDLTVHSKDEIGKAGEALNTMKNNLREIIQSIAGTAEHVASASEEISSSATQQAQSAETQKDQTAQVATAMQEMSSTVLQVSENSNQAAEAARQPSETARRGGTIVEGSLKKMRLIADSYASLDIVNIRQDLVAKIRAAAEFGARMSGKRRVRLQVFKPLEPVGVRIPPSVIVIGTSTGGPKALQQILPMLPGDLSVPVLIVQHMPAGFTEAFANRLNNLCKVAVREALNDAVIEPRTVYIARAGLHMTLVRKTPSRVALRLSSNPSNTLHIPSVDVTMLSVAELYGPQAMGIIMTGMGADGVQGMEAIVHAGGFTVGQDESSCTVYGMPRACAEARILRRVVPLHQIPAEILEAVAYHSRSKPASAGS